MKSKYFCIFYIWMFFKLLVFFVDNLPNPVAMPELPNWSASKAWQVLSTKKQQHFYKKKITCNHHCPLWHEHSHWSIVIPGIPSDLRSRSKQPHHLSGSLLPPVTTGSKQFPTGIPTFNSTEKAIITNYDHILKKKQQEKPLLEFIYMTPSAECNVPINRPTTVKGLIKVLQ